MHRRAILKAAVFAPALRSVSAASAEGPAIAYVRDGNLWSAALDGSGRRQLTGSGRDSHPAWSRDGGSLAFLRREKPEDDADFGRLYVMRRDGSRERRATPHLCTRPLWSPVADEIATVGSPEPEQLRLVFLSPEGRPSRAAIPLEKMVQPPPWGWMALSDWHLAGKLMRSEEHTS